MSIRKTKPWQQSMRQLPPALVTKAHDSGPSIQLGVVKEIFSDDLDAGHYQHLGLSIAPEAQTWSTSPPPGVGLWSRRSQNGWTEVHRDRPKEDVEFSWLASSWGRGWHIVTQVRPCYPRTEHPPEHLSFTLSIEPTPQGSYLLTALLDEPLDVNAPDFETQLFRNGNLVQENLGGVDVFRAGASRAEYLASLRVPWKILPILQNEELLDTLDRVIANLGNKIEPRERDLLLDRLEMLKDLNPQQLVVGDEGFQRYFGALLAPDLVVFENLRYGNAIYVFGEDWKVVSKLSRTQLLSGVGYDFTRIRHGRNWKERLREEIVRRLDPPEPPAIAHPIAA